MSYGDSDEEGDEEEQQQGSGVQGPVEWGQTTKTQCKLFDDIIWWRMVLLNPETLLPTQSFVSVGLLLGGAGFCAQ